MICISNTTYRSVNSYLASGKFLGNNVLHSKTLSLLTNPSSLIQKSNSQLLLQQLCFYSKIYAFIARYMQEKIYRYLLLLYRNIYIATHSCFSVYSDRFNKYTCSFLPYSTESFKMYNDASELQCFLQWQNLKHVLTQRMKVCDLQPAVGSHTHSRGLNNIIFT